LGGPLNIKNVGGRAGNLIVLEQKKKSSGKKKEMEAFG
jgi:hypothetical protein